MLTRLRVSGFKNLVDVDISFGVFTCIAGVNGVGKSNLFDAIQFLSALAKKPLIKAASMVRDGSRKTDDIRNLFHRVGDNYTEKMSFEAEMIIPSEGIGDLGNKIKATATFLRYSLELAYRKDSSSRFLGQLEILREELTAIDKTEIDRHLLFDCQTDWKESLIKGVEQKLSKFIYTDTENQKESVIILDLQLEGGQKGFLPAPAKNLSRTLLSTINDGGSGLTPGTIILAHQEMLSWQLLQLEPSSLRKSDEFTVSKKLGTDGSNLAATLYYLAGKNYYQEEADSITENEIESRVYAQLGNRLSELLDDINEVWVDKDNSRKLLTLMVKNKDGTVHPAHSLSDGTMRFLALIVLELDPESPRLLCLEEPENGIHPERIITILDLLQDIATDVEEPVGLDNPLRQVIINTHSPVIVQQVPDNSLLVAELKETVMDGKRFKRACFSYLPNTWRDRELSENNQSNLISKGELLSYLNPVSPNTQKNRVIDRPDLKSLIPGNREN